MGNALLNRMIWGLFGGVFTDISSGYRVMSRRLVKSFPALSQRFEIEPELAAHCAHLRLPCAEMPTRYVERPEGGESKLRTLRDGRRALLTIGLLLKEFHPFLFFTSAAAALALVAFVLACPSSSPSGRRAWCRDCPRRCCAPAWGWHLSAAYSAGSFWTASTGVGAK